MKCTKCNKQLPENMRFCKYCGTPIVFEETHTTKKKRSSTPLIVVLCILIIAAIATAVMVYNDNYKSVLSKIGFWQESDPVAAADRTEPVATSGREGITTMDAGVGTREETTKRFNGYESYEAAIAAYIGAYEQRDYEKLASISVFSLIDHHPGYEVDSSYIWQVYYESFDFATYDYGMNFTTSFTVHSVREVADYEDENYAQMFADIGVTKVMEASASQTFHGSEDAVFPDKTFQITLTAVEVKKRWYISTTYSFRLLD